MALLCHGQQRIAWLSAVQQPEKAGFPTAGLTTLGQVTFHAGTLRRAVLNLLQNALEAMSQGSTVTLEGQGMATQPRTGGEC